MPDADAERECEHRDERQRRDDPPHPRARLAVPVQPRLREEQDRDQQDERKPVRLGAPERAPERRPLAVAERAQHERHVEAERQPVTSSATSAVTLTRRRIADRSAVARRADGSARMSPHGGATTRELRRLRRSRRRTGLRAPWCPHPTGGRGLLASRGAEGVERRLAHHRRRHQPGLPAARCSSRRGAGTRSACRCDGLLARDPHRLLEVRACFAYVTPNCLSGGLVW